jgi:carbonic anhydrase
MKTSDFSFLIVGLALVSFSCSQTPEESENTSQQISQPEQPQPLVEKVLTADEQAALTPEEVINLLRDGNERFLNNELTMRDHSEQVRQSTYAQYPKAIVLSCVDSRVPVEDVFDRGIGDVFVARVAGNFVNEDILGSMEFACKVSGSKLILVLGHEHCGAVKATIDDVKLGNITAMLENIKPAVELASDYQGEKTSQNTEFVHMVCENNVRNTISEIRNNSPILAEMEENGEIQIIGGIYDMDNGKVTFLDQQGTAMIN